MKGSGTVMIELSSLVFLAASMLSILRKNLLNAFTHFCLDNDVNGTSKRRRIFKLLTKMVLNFFKFFKLFNFIAFFYS